MKTEQFHWTVDIGWSGRLGDELGEMAQLVLIFGDRALLKDPQHVLSIAAAYPRACLIGCSTAGEIVGTRVVDESVVVTAVHFESTRVKRVAAKIDGAGRSFEVGEDLARALQSEGLVHVFVLSDGLSVNGSELVQGITEHLPSEVSVTGGLSGDGARFEETLVVVDGAASSNTVAVLGFYGDQLRVGYGSLGGWDPFGPERLITRAEGNVLYEFDGKSALALYKKYLGDHASDLPSSALHYPLSIRTPEGSAPLVRTILAVSEDDQSMTFAGDVPEGTYGRFMKANFDRLIDGAVDAASTSYQALTSSEPDLAVLISCVGRKLVLQQRVEEEVEGVRSVMGDSTALAGFYSYGEISPFGPNAKCELHNQTMTITTFSELPE